MCNKYKKWDNTYNFDTLISSLLRVFVSMHVDTDVPT